MGKSERTKMIAGLYLITDEAYDLVDRVANALLGGVAALQYRDKRREKSARFTLGRTLGELCARAGVLFIVNDDVELAVALDADGVHLGQEDGDPGEARKALGPDKIIGVSTHTLDEALRAEAAGADYLGFGAMFPTSSKEVVHLPGPTALAAMRSRIGIPVVAIGGINRDNAPAVIDGGADAIAVISAILGSGEPALAASELALLFNRAKPFPRGAVLTIAGSDSGGGAGIQADLKTISLLGSYGASVITALTAQNTRGVSAIEPVSPAFVGQQLDAVLSDIPIDVVKTGMLPTAAVIDLIVERLHRWGHRLVVVDPVMRATTGTSLVEGEWLSAMKERLIPLAYLLTPNVPEAEYLVGRRLMTETDREEGAKILWQMGARNVLLKGGHLPGEEAVDLLFDGVRFTRFPAPRFATEHTHGTGCTLASAAAAFLAQGLPLPEAVSRAKEFITFAISLATPLGQGRGPVNHFLAALESRSRHHLKEFP